MRKKSAAIGAGALLASLSESGRAPMGGNKRLLNFADKVARQREVCQASDKAPCIPVAGTPSSATNQKLQVDLLIPGNIAALRAMDVYPEFPHSSRVFSRNPLDVRGAFAGSWVSNPGRPRTIRMDTSGARENENWADPYAAQYLCPVTGEGCSSVAFGAPEW